MKPILVDSGFLVALYKRLDASHRLCMQAYERLQQPLATCEAVIAETAHLLRFTPGSTESILASIEEGILALPFSLQESAASVRKIRTKYADVPADFADACLIHMADELDTGDILTLDSDFKHYRWRRSRAFNLLIPLD